MTPELRACLEKIANDACRSSTGLFRHAPPATVFAACVAAIVEAKKLESCPLVTKLKEGVDYELVYDSTDKTRATYEAWQKARQHGGR